MSGMVPFCSQFRWSVLSPVTCRRGDSLPMAVPAFVVGSEESTEASSVGANVDVTAAGGGVPPQVT